MSKIFLICFLFISGLCYGQYPLNQTIGADSTLVTSKGGFKGRLVNWSFADTAAANLQRIRQYPGAQIFTTNDSLFWLRNPTATKWIQIFTNTGGAGGDTLVWKLTGNLVGARQATPGLGTLDAYDLNIITDGQIRLSVPSGGIVHNLAPTTVALRYDTVTKQMYHGDAGGGTTYTFSNGLNESGGTVGLGGTLDQTTIIDIDGNDFILENATDMYINNTVNLTTGNRLVGINVSGGGQIGNINVGSGLSLSGGTLSASGGSQNLQQVTNVGNTTDTAIYTGGTISYDTYGTVWSDNFARASLGSNYVNSAASSTITFPGSEYMNLTGAAGATAWTNLIARTDSTNENKGTIYTDIVINSKSATSYGFAIGWGNLNTLCCDHHVYGGVTLTSGTNNLFIVAESANLVYTDATALTINAADSFRISLTQQDWTYRLDYINFTQNVKHSFNLTGIPQGSVLPLTPNGFSRPVFVHLGGDMRVRALSRVSNESKNARNVFIGNSLTLGGNITDPSSRWTYIATGNHANTVVSAGGGTVASYSNSTWTADLSRYAAGSAENFWLMCGGNDSLFSVWENVGKPAAIELRNRVVGAGKRFIWLTPMPRNSLNLTSVRDTIIAIATRYGDPYVDFFGRFAVSGNQLPASFNAGDGTHLTVTANLAMGRYADSLYPQYTRQNYLTGDQTAYRTNSQYATFTGLQEWNYTAASQSMTVRNDTREVKINPSSALATFTVNLPYDVQPGYEVLITFGGTITSGVVVTSFNLAGASGQTVIKAGFVTPQSTNYSFAAGDAILCRYQASGYWIAMPNQTYQNTPLYVQQHTIGRGLNTATQDNFAAGYFALASTTSGSANTAVGSQALQQTTTGVRNTALGVKTLLANFTGSNNTAIGEEALSVGASANNRTAVGYASLYNTAGADNTAVGVNAGFNTTSGTNNTFIGSNAGVSHTTGSNNLYLGGFSGSGFTTSSNRIFISDGSGNIRLYSDNNGNIGVGNTAPADKLDVTGNLSLNTAGNKIKIATGSNASIGTATLVAGTVTVSTTAVTTSSKIFVSVDTPGGTQGFISVPTASIVNATSFVINSSSVLETSTVNYLIIN